MLEVVTSVINTLAAKIAEILLNPVVNPRLDKRNVCQNLGHLYFVSQLLSRQATRFHHAFENFTKATSNDDNNEVKQKLRRELRELLNWLQKYEEHTREMFVALNLVNDSEDNPLGSTFVAVPWSSARLFQKYFVDDIAPRFVANAPGSEYLLRTTINVTNHPVVEFDQLGRISIDLRKLFKEGHLSWEGIDISDKSKVSGFSQELAADIQKLEAATKRLGDIILKHCELGEILLTS